MEQKQTIIVYYLDARREWELSLEAGEGMTTEYNPVRRNSVYAEFLRQKSERGGKKYNSISHSDHFCVCCSSDIPCGIDLEKIRYIPQQMIPEGFSYNPTRFLKEWTALESYVKLRGLTLHECSRLEQIAWKESQFIYIEQITGYELCLCLYAGINVNVEMIYCHGRAVR